MYTVSTGANSDNFSALKKNAPESQIGAHSLVSAQASDPEAFIRIGF